MSSHRFVTLLLRLIVPLTFMATGHGQSQPPVQPPARTDPIPVTSQAERSFVKFALGSSRTEVATADLAMDQGADPMVKALAKMIVDDHTKSNATLEDIARKKTIETKVAADLDNHLASLKGPEFDRAFIKQMISDHTDAIERFKLAEKQITDSELRDFIAATLPTLQAHLDQAKSLSKDTPEKLSAK